MTDTRTSNPEPQKFPKSHANYWRDKLTTRSNDEFHVRIRFGGVQHWWPLKTVNSAKACEKARDIWQSLQSHGLEATEAKFKPWTAAPKPEKEVLTIGEYITKAKAVAVVRPTTFTTYERKLRFLASQVAKVKGTKARHDYVNGGAKKWRDNVDKMLFTDLTPQAIAEWRVRYLSKFDGQPMKRQQAQTSAASIIRNAKALFSNKILAGMDKELRSKVLANFPFTGVDLGKRPRVRYHSRVDAGALAAAAWNELKDAEPEMFKIFLLAFGAGLRRGEIDRLMWKAFDWNKGTLRIEATEYGIAKTDGSHDDIDLGKDLLEYFKAQIKDGKGDFVIASGAAPTAAPHWNRYRCDCSFKKLLDWLRKKGVTARNPLHTLRKEFGSLINQKFGIFAASAALRHSNITITREAYVDKKERIALDLGELMKAKGAA